jgi:Flp pilus assembly protein TadG
MAARLVKRLLPDSRGNVLVEATVMMTLIFIFVLGGIDFLFAFYQWNSAVKAVERGARIAAVSDPVASNLNSLNGTPGGTVPIFDIVCNSGGSGSCSCTGSGCPGSVSFSSAALDNIVFGRGNTSPNCPAAPTTYTMGMCNMLPAIAEKNVQVEYAQTTGIGFAGRPGGPAPTVTVSLQNFPFTFYFLGGLMGFGNLNINVKTSITGEDLSSSAPS